MKGVRSLLILIVVAAALGGYLYYDSKHDTTDQKKLEKVFDGVKADAINRVTIKSVAGDTTTVQKQADKWQVTQPAAAPADEGEISGIASNLASLEVQRVVDDKPSDVKQYGLEPPRIQVTFNATGKDRTLLLGQKTPTGTDLYARLPDSPRVFMVSSFVEATFNKSSFDLRDKTILKVDRDKTDSLTIETPEHALKFTKQGSDWRLTSPIEARADFGAVEGVLGRLNTAPMKALTAAAPTDLAQYGLDKPAITVRIGSGSSQAGLAVGKTAGEGVVYAKDLSRPMVFTIESALADELKKPAGDFRVKDLFDSRSFNTSRVEIVRNGQTLAFEKDKDAWKQVTPSAKAADTAKVEALLTALTNTRAASFLDTSAGTGLDTPEITVTVKFEDKQEKVFFAKHGADTFARRDGDPGAVKIDAPALDGITKALDALK